MNINLITLYSFLSKKDDTLIKEDLLFVDEINNYLMNDDLLILENAKDAVFNIILIGSGGTENLFLKRLNDLPEPLVILSTSRNNSLPASLEIKTYLENHNKLCFLLAGDENHIANMIKHIATIINAYNNVKDNRLGLIGNPSNWLIVSPVEPKMIYQNFKQNIVKIKMKELEDLIEQEEKEMLDIKVVPHAKELIAKAESRDDLQFSLVIYNALQTACLALAMLNEEGITSGCEGDVPSLVTMHIVNSLTNRSSFMANPSKFNYEDNSIMLAHCTVPLNMVTSYKLTTHFESGLGIGVKGELPEGRITLCKIAPDYTLDNTLCIPATLKENLSLEGYCRTQISVALGEEGLLEILKASFGNHVIVSYGDVYQDFLPLLSLLRR